MEEFMTRTKESFSYLKNVCRNCIRSNDKNGAMLALAEMHGVLRTVYTAKCTLYTKLGDFYEELKTVYKFMREMVSDME